jgi:hypothetical protein
VFVARVANPIPPFLATVLVPSPWSTLRSRGFASERGLTLAMNACSSYPFRKGSVDGRVVDGWFTMGVLRHGQALPLHPRVEYPQDEVKEAMRAQFTLWATLGHREVWKDKCGELRGGELDGNRRRYSFLCQCTHGSMMVCFTSGKHPPLL